MKNRSIVESIFAEIAKRNDTRTRRDNHLRLLLGLNLGKRLRGRLHELGGKLLDLRARMQTTGIAAQVLYDAADPYTRKVVIDRGMADAIAMANRDVGGFAEPDPARFVSATWLLIEESNAPLAAVGVYTLREYREALTRMQGFLQALRPERVFHHYAGFPPEQELDRKSTL